jgi:hypothetical protein
MSSSSLPGWRSLTFCYVHLELVVDLVSMQLDAFLR